MIDTLQVFQELQEVLPPEAARRVAEIIGRVYEELQQGITRTEFQDLQRAMAELAEAQRQTERQLQALTAQMEALGRRVDGLTQRVEELAEAQRQTEQQIQALTAQMEALGRRVDGLAQRVEELAEAQRQTEQRLQALTARVDGLAQQVEKLAEVQRQTEAEVLSLSRSVKELTGELRETRQQLGGLAMTVGYTLENEAFKALPRLLARDFGLRVHEPLRRKYVIDREGDLLEVNIIGHASQDGESVTIVGEAKVQLSKNDVDRFIRKKLKRLEGALPGRLFPVLVTHMTTAADVEAYARNKGIALYYSYDF
ncbi:Chromosome partition protein Smc [bacterium HR11]|nr:Chromosome partition protein Smc [bacterium HR11]